MFQDIDHGEIQELIIHTTPEELTEHDLMEMRASKALPDDKKRRQRRSSARKQTGMRRFGTSFN